MAKAKKAKIAIEDVLLPIDEHPYEIPQNWCWVKHNGVLDISGGSQPAKSYFISEPTEGYIKLYQTRDYGDNPVPVYIPEKYATKTTLEGDILLARYGGSLGKVFRAHEGAYNVALAKVIKLYPDLIDDEYLYKYYFTQFYQDFCVKASKGRSAQAGFNRDDMNNIPFPLPPLAEQRRIVEQIEGLFSKLDEVKEKIECLLDSKKVRCNSVLNKAFTGKLTAKWRENNNIKFETWEYINFEKIIVEGPQNGMYKPKTSYGSGTKILRIDCFYDGKLEPWEKLKRLEITDEEKHTYLLSVNDIVVNRVNSMPYLGKSALIRKLPEQCVFESNMMRIKINIRKANPEYVIRYLNSSIGLQELRKNAKQAVNQASINQQDVKMVKIALPSLEEQNEIVKIITSISNKDEAILNKAEAVIEEIDLMKESILAKAFRGELGTNISKEKNSIEVLKKLIEEESK